MVWWIGLNKALGYRRHVALCIVVALGIGLFSHTALAGDARLEAAQNRLTSLGYTPGRANGKMSARTRQALRAYQKDQALKPTGKLDGPTAKLLLEVPSSGIAPQNKTLTPSPTAPKNGPAETSISPSVLSSPGTSNPPTLPPSPSTSSAPPAYPSVSETQSQSSRVDTPPTKSGGSNLGAILTLFLGALGLAIIVKRSKSKRTSSHVQSSEPVFQASPVSSTGETVATVPTSKLAIPVGSTPSPAQNPSKSNIRIIPIEDEDFQKIKPPNAARPSETRWVGKSAEVEVRGVKITRGLFFLGEKLGSNGWQNENCLVRPSLNVVFGRGGDDLPYYPNYSNITPTARGAYLRWLASSRDDPSTPIGLVFLYFYGLEYRLLQQNAVADRSDIIAEVERLLLIYGEQRSFSHYARTLLAAARFGQEIQEPTPSLDRIYNSEIPIEVRYWLGLKVARGTPLNARDALLWLANLPDCNFRTPAVRCFDYFQKLWTQRFDAQHKAGLKISAPTTMLKPTYRAASSSFAVDLLTPKERVPDISVINAPLRRLRDLAEECTVALEPYSRYLGRNPAEQTNASALLLLPAELQSDAVFGALARRIETLLASNAGLTTLSSLCEVLGIKIPSAGRVPQSAVLQASQILNRLSIGMEPDRRYGGIQAERSGPIVLFKIDDISPTDGQSTAHQSSRTLVEVGILAAAADGTVSDDEFRSLEQFIAGLSATTPGELSRLRAYGLALRYDLPKQQAVWKRLSTLSAIARTSIAQLGVSLVLSDGQISASEVKFLERLYTALGLDPNDVYAALHRQEATSEPPTTTQPGPIANGKIVIDRERLERLRSETNAASNLLADIFKDDEADHASPIVVSEPSAFPGLDADHAAIVQQLVAEGSLTRPVFDELARQHRLLPDGAIETINQWAFDQFDEPILEDDDTVIIVEHLRNTLSSTRVTV